MDVMEPSCQPRVEQRRQKLIEAARQLFIKNGFHATGIAQIARESQIAVGQIYRDFASKEDIVAALVRTDCQKFLLAANLRVAVERGDLVSIENWLHDMLQPNDDVEGNRLFAEIVAESSRNSRIAAIFNGIHDEMRDNLLTALSLLAPGSALRAQRGLLADALLTISLGLLHHRLMRPALPLEPLVRLFRTIINEQVDAMNCTTNRKTFS